MLTMDFRIKMPGDGHCPRIDTVELKHHIERRLGRQKSEKYFTLLHRFITLQLSKSEFDKLCIGLFGRANISLHNGLIRAIIRNACITEFLPKVGKGSNRYSNLRSLRPPRKGRTPTIHCSRSKEPTSPLGSHGKSGNLTVTDKGSRPTVEATYMEEGEEVEQVSSIVHARSPITAPLGVLLPAKATKKAAFIDFNTCYHNGELPDTSSLRERLEQKFGKEEGLTISNNCADSLNNALNVFMKRIMKPCLQLAASRSELRLANKAFHNSSCVSMTDFRVAMQSDRDVQLEKVNIIALDDLMD